LNALAARVSTFMEAAPVRNHTTTLAREKKPSTSSHALSDVKRPIILNSPAHMPPTMGSASTILERT